MTLNVKPALSSGDLEIPDLSSVIEQPPRSAAWKEQSVMPSFIPENSPLQMLRIIMALWDCDGNKPHRGTQQPAQCASSCLCHLKSSGNLSVLTHPCVFFSTHHHGNVVPQRQYQRKENFYIVSLKMGAPKFSFSRSPLEEAVITIKKEQETKASEALAYPNPSIVTLKSHHHTTHPTQRPQASSGRDGGERPDPVT